VAALIETVRTTSVAYHWKPAPAGTLRAASPRNLCTATAWHAGWIRNSVASEHCL